MELVDILTWIVDLTRALFLVPNINDKFQTSSFRNPHQTLGPSQNFTFLSEVPGKARKMRWWKETMAGKQTPPTFFKGPRKTWGGYRTWFAHLFGGQKWEEWNFCLQLKNEKNKMSDSQVEERAQKFPFPVGKSTKWLVVRSVREVSPKIYSEPFRFRNYIFRTICRRFSFVVDDALNLLTNLGPRRKSPWSRRIAGIERFDPPFGGWQNRANLPGWSIMLGWCSPFLPRCVKRGNDPCWRAGRWLVG